MGVRAPRTLVTRASQRHSRDIRHNSYVQPRSWRARGSGGTGHRSTSGHARSTDWQNTTSPYAYPAHHPYPPLPPPPHRSLPLQSSVYAFSPPPLVIIPLRSVIVLPTSSTSIVHPLVCWAAPRSSNVASSSSNDAPSRSRGMGHVVQVMPHVVQGGLQVIQGRPQVV